MKILRNLINKIRGEYSTDQLVSRGMQVGENFQRQNAVILDPDHCWLIDIGDNVTLAPRVHILCHDASTKRYLGVTKIGCVKIGNNVFVGADSLVLPGVNIGSNVIIGANSTVTKDIPDNTVVAGCPAQIICTLDEFIEKEREQMQKSPCYGSEYTLRENVSMELRRKQKQQLEDHIGYID